MGKAELVDHLYDHISSLSKKVAGSDPAVQAHGSQMAHSSTQSTTLKTFHHTVNKFQHL